MSKIWGVSKAEKSRQQRVNYSYKVGMQIDSEHYKSNKPPKPGVKSTVIKEYIEKGKLAAWQILQEYNKKISGEGFTLEMLEKWIGEYEEEQAQRTGKDDEYDR